jgi:DNA-binding CsgD family transcriptional regulator
MAKKSNQREASGKAVRMTDVEKVFGLRVGEARALYEKLTARQREVANLMAQGKSNREIADELGISVKTLDIHRGDVYGKLQVRTSAGVAIIVQVATLANAASER